MKRQVSFVDTEFTTFTRRVLRRLQNLQDFVTSYLSELTPPPQAPNSPILIDLTQEEEEPTNIYIDLTHPNPTLLFDDPNDPEPVLFITIPHLINDEEGETESEAGETTNDEQSDSDRTLGTEDTWSLEEEDTEEDLQFVLEE